MTKHGQKKLEFLVNMKKIGHIIFQVFR